MSSSAFNWRDEIIPYTEELKANAVPENVLQERMKMVRNIDELKAAVQQLLATVFFPDLSESAEQIIDNALKDDLRH